MGRGSRGGPRGAARLADLEAFQPAADLALHDAAKARAEIAAGMAAVSEGVLGVHTAQSAEAQLASMPDLADRQGLQARNRVWAAQQAHASAQAQLADARERLALARRRAEQTEACYRDAARQTSLRLDDAAEEVRSALALVPEAQLGFLMLNTASPAERLAWLETADPQEVRRMLADHPGLAQTFWEDPPDGAAVAEWWNRLHRPEQDALALLAPSIIGNLGGVDSRHRDLANTTLLRVETDRVKASVDALKKRLAETPAVVGAGRARPNGVSESVEVQLAAAENRLGQLRDIRAALDDAANHRGARFLTDLNLGVLPPLAAVSIGNPDTAHNVAYAVPGMNTRIEGEKGHTMKNWTAAVQNVYDAESDSGADIASSHAIVAWIGYDAPNELQETYTANVDAGATRLAAELDGLQETRSEAGNPASVGILAHSAGTTLTSIALTQTVHDIDRVVLIGSAGLVTQPTEWHVASIDGQPQVFATHAPGDQLATVGYTATATHPIDPDDPPASPPPNAPGLRPTSTVRGGAPAQGVTIFSSNGEPSLGLAGTDGHEVIGDSSGGYPILARKLPLEAATRGHGYLDHQTESLYNSVWALTGHSDRIVGPQIVIAPDGGVSTR